VVYAGQFGGAENEFTRGCQQCDERFPDTLDWGTFAEGAGAGVGALAVGGGLAAHQREYESLWEQHDVFMKHMDSDLNVVAQNARPFQVQDGFRNYGKNSDYSDNSYDKDKTFLQRYEYEKLRRASPLYDDPADAVVLSDDVNELGRNFAVRAPTRADTFLQYFGRKGYIDQTEFARGKNPLRSTAGEAQLTERMLAHEKEYAKYRNTGKRNTVPYTDEEVRGRAAERGL
jgi:hypothetical protein